MNISFSGCGFLGLYHVGVASAIREYAPELVVGQISGASAGAIAACALVCGSCLGQATTDVLKIAIQARSRALGALHPSFNIVKILREGLRNILPPNAHKLASGRLNVSLTRFSDGKNVVVTQFDSKEELIQALICSAFIPFYCGAIPPSFRGVRYIDGGWSDNCPQLNAETITVSPFSGESDICPRDLDSGSLLNFDLNNTSIRFTANNLYRISVALFPPHPEILSELCRQGFQDTLRFLALRNLISCTRCVAVRSSVTVPKGTGESTAETPAFYLPDNDGESSDDADDLPMAAKMQLITPPNSTKVSPVCSSASLCDHDHAGSTRLEPGKRPHGEHQHAATQGMKKSKTVAHRSLCDEPSQMVKSRTSLNMRQNNCSEGKMRKRCETCCELEEIAPKKGLPPIVVKKLKDAEDLDKTVFGYLMRTKPGKLIRYMTIPWFLPWDLCYATVVKFLDWLPTLPEDTKWLASRATRTAEFILGEIRKQQSSAKITCQLNITEMNFQASSGGNRPKSIVDSVDCGGRRGSSVSRHGSLERLRRSGSTRSSDRRPGVQVSQSFDNIARGIESSTPDCKVTVTSVNFGFSVELSNENRSVNVMRQLMAQDCLAGPIPMEQVVQAAEAVEFEGLMRTLETADSGAVNLTDITTDALGHSPMLKSRQDSVVIDMPSGDGQFVGDQSVADGMIHTPVGVPHANPVRHSVSVESSASKTPMNDDVDTMASILDFTRHHDALMAFYYMDENSGKMKVCEIYGLDNTAGGSGGTDPFVSQQHASVLRSETLSSRRQASLRLKKNSSQPTSRRPSFSKRRSLILAESTVNQPAVKVPIEVPSDVPLEKAREEPVTEEDDKKDACCSPINWKKDAKLAHIDRNDSGIGGAEDSPESSVFSLGEGNKSHSHQQRSHGRSGTCVGQSGPRPIADSPKKGPSRSPSLSVKTVLTPLSPSSSGSETEFFVPRSSGRNSASKRKGQKKEAEEGYEGELSSDF